MEIQSFFQEYIHKMRKNQEIILNILESEANDELLLESSLKYINDHKIKENKNELKLFLHLIAKITENHHRFQVFHLRFERFFSFFKDEIKNNFSNIEIFDIFKRNKRILLFLFEEKILIPDKYISLIITKYEYQRKLYPQYFYLEFNSFFDENLKKTMNFRYKSIIELIKSDIKAFKQKRKEGENDDFLCELIRNDSINEFISFLNKSNLTFSMKIKPSVFETNYFLIKNRPTLIEYASFFGSLNIIKYLIKNDVELKPSLWLYAIHSNNAELIHLLEENHIEPIDETYKECFKESIKCHHIDIMNYLKNNWLQNEDEFETCLRYYNFSELSNEINKMIDFNDPKFFYNLCKYDYIEPCEFLLKNIKININEKIINN